MPSVLCKFLIAGTFAAFALLGSSAHAASATETSNYQYEGASFGSEFVEQCGVTEFGSPMYAFFGFFASTQDVRVHANGQPDTKSTNLNFGYFNQCTGVWGSIHGQTDYNPDNLVSIDNSDVASNLRSAQLLATVPMNLSVYADGVFKTCAIQAQVTASLQSSAHPVNSTDTITEQGPSYKFVYHSSGKRVSADGTFDIQLSMTPDCIIPGLPSSFTGSTVDALITDSNAASLTVTHQVSP